MKFYIGVTDKSWFNFLSYIQPDEVNFWQPGGNAVFRALTPGELFLFKLHYPDNYIVGGGFFVKHSIVPLSLAWSAFGPKNGTNDFDVFRNKIIMYRRRNNLEHELDPMIGCIILSQPFFFRREDWIPAPESFNRNIVQGKTYSGENTDGALLFEVVQSRIQIGNQQLENVDQIAEDSRQYGSDYMTRARLGQGAFRILVTDSYKRKCAITGERTLPVLESAHIKPYSLSGPHKIENGLLLRSDLHKLFDLGYMTITTDLHVEVSRRIREEYENGREYYALHGRELINLPDKLSDRPSKNYIQWHNENKFVP